MQRALSSRPTSSTERGYALIVILVMLAVLMLALMAVAPSIATQIRREREQELIHRGRQYAIAIKRFYKKNGAYPTSLEQLENTNRMRFLRRRFKDPMTESGEWRLIHLGEAKVTPTGLFGKPISAASGGGPAQIGTPAANIAGGTPSQSVGTPAAQSSGGSSGSLSGRTFGGGPIVGVASTSTAQSIKELNGKDHYNDWEFFYDPRFDVGPGGTPVANPQLGQPGVANPQQPPGTPAAPNPNLPK